MNNKEQVIQQIEVLKRYVSKGWDTSMSFYELDINRFREKICSCSDELIEAIENDASPKELKNIFLPYISYLKSLRMGETEEREYMCGTFYELSLIVSVDIAFKLNCILYGFIFTFLTDKILFPRKKKKIVDQDLDNDIVEQKYESCEHYFKIRSFHNNNEQENKTSYAIVGCKECGTLNLISVEGDTSSFYFSRVYYLMDILPEDFDDERAKQRFEQVKYWRYNN